MSEKGTEENQTELAVLLRIEEKLEQLLGEHRALVGQLRILVSSVQHGAQRGRY